MCWVHVLQGIMDYLFSSYLIFVITWDQHSLGDKSVKHHCRKRGKRGKVVLQIIWCLCRRICQYLSRFTWQILAGWGVWITSFCGLISLISLWKVHHSYNSHTQYRKRMCLHQDWSRPSWAGGAGCIFFLMLIFGMFSCLLLSRSEVFCGLI